jgi:NADH-quinone oxidoreductase subunit A
LNPEGAATGTLIPFVIYIAAIVGVVAGMLVFSAILGQRHRERATDDLYESGIPPTGTARVRFSVKFYLVGMLFVIFDLEAVFLFAWAIAVLDAGWQGYVGALVFLIILTVALIYEWRMGALDWGSSSLQRRILKEGVKGVR